MSRISSEQVRQAFQNAGIWNRGQLDQAETVTNRINDLAKLKPEGFDPDTKAPAYTKAQADAIGNLFGLIRSRVFTSTADDAAVHRANSVTYAALRELGVADKLQHASAASLEHLKMDVTAHAYEAMVKDVAGLGGWSGNDELRRAAEAEGLSITSISWDDPSRVGTNSPWGANIIDSSIGVVTSDAKTGQSSSHLMPIIRQPNLQDVTADIDMESFKINVGNARGEPLRQISLKQALEKPWDLMKDPEKWPLRDADGNKVGLYAAGTDEQALVAAQSSLLPVSKQGGQATFVPAAYSYTSYTHDEHGPQPTVLTLMVTREGTSMEILGDDEKEQIGRGADQLHFNENGERAPLTAERAAQSDVPVDTSGNGQANADQANRILFIQVPLIPEHQRPQRPIFLEMASFGVRGIGGGDLDDAVIGHGPTEGPYKEDMGKGWKRDPNTPVRVTVQFAKTLEDPSSLDAAALKAIRAEIDAVYANASRVGSLVMTGDGTNPTPPWLPGPPVIPFNATGTDN